MLLNLSDRVQESLARIGELVSEVNELSVLAASIRALAEVTSNPDKYRSSQEDIAKLIDRVRDICARHEIVLPDYVEWNTIEIS